MAEDTYLPDDFLRQLTAVGEVDILIGLPTFNNRDTIERAVSAVEVGLVKYFPRERTALVIPDGGSTDGTSELVKSAVVHDFRTHLTAKPLRTVQRITTGYRRMAGKERALRIIFAAADLLRAKACAILSPDVESITPEWVERLVRPVVKENFDFVAPLYQRHKFDGLMVKQIFAPVIRAAYGYRIQEPVGGEFGLSGRLACHYLAQEIWQEEISRLGMDIWMSTTAMVDGYRLCQSFLGPKVHGSKPQEPDLVGTIQRVVGALFRSLERHESYWLSRNTSEPLPSFGFESGVASKPVRMNRKRMMQMFRMGVDQLGSILQAILTPETLGAIQEISRREEKDFRFPDELWVKSVYEFASSYHHSVMNRDHLLQALTPLYRGRTASFVQENQKSDADKCEKKLEELCLSYEQLKAYGVARWRRTV